MTSESCRNGGAMIIFILLIFHLYLVSWIRGSILWYITGTERCNEALEKLEKKYDIVVNIQGDEPLLEPEIIDGIVKALQVCYSEFCKLASAALFVLFQWYNLFLVQVLIVSCGVKMVFVLQAAPDAVFSTAVTSLKPEDAFDPNRVKCVVDNRGYAIYFSRGLIPFNK